jgi:ligand-binding sensor domain-containing protein
MKASIHLPLSLLLTCCLSMTVRALDPHKALSEYGLDKWYETDGLPQSSISSIVQTSDGYLWLGTRGGLVRFDGVKFTLFNTQTQSLKDDEVMDLIEDEKGGLWIGTYGGGLTIYRHGKFTTFTENEGLAGDQVLSIQKGKGGVIWIGTSDGLSRYKDGKFTNYTMKDGLAGNKIRSLYMDSSGTLWIGSPSGLNLFKEERITLFDQKGLGTRPSINRITGSSDGTIWIQKRGSSIYRLRGDEVKQYSFSRDFNAREMHVDKDSSVWIASDIGLLRFKDQEFSLYNSGPAGIATPTTLCFDHEGSLWIGTQSEGLARLKDFHLVTFTADDGLQSNFILSVYESSRGSLWIGSSGGADEYKDGKITSHSITHNSRNLPMHTVVEDRHGAIWAGTVNGVFINRNGRFVQAEDERLQSGEIKVMYRDSRGRLWIGVDETGLYLFDGDQITLYRDELAGRYVRAIYEDSEGTVWIGDRRAGLARLRDGKFTLFKQKDGLANESIMAIHGDSGSKSLWIATRNGLNRLKDGQFSTIRAEDGLYVSSIHGILEDRSGNFWMSSARGIFRVRKEELNDFADGRTRVVHSIPYGVRDGMQTNACTSGFQPITCTTRNGQMWFATYKGVVRLDPNLLQINRQVPPVHIEQIVVDNKRVTPVAKINMPPGAGDLEIEYTALSYLAPEKVRFKYKLEGFDNDWVEAGTRRIAYYTNLPPGPYRFHVIASNNDGIWNSTGANLELYLKPHFYETGWFYVACVMTLGLMVFGIYRFHIMQERGRFTAVLEERARIAREIHDTLAQGFVGIAAQLQGVRAKLVEQPDEAGRHLDLAINMVRHSLVESRNSVWDMRTRALESGDLIGALYKLCNEMDGTIPVRFHVVGTPFSLSPLVESNLYRISQEGIANALKHAHPSEIRIELSFDSDKLRLLVQDDGCGFDTEVNLSLRTGNFGLLGIRERVKKIGAELFVRSRIGGGTEIEVVMPAG